LLTESKQRLNRTDFYFDIFLQKIKNVSHNEYLKEITRYNENLNTKEDFFSLVISKYPEFEELYRRELLIKHKSDLDIMEYIIRNSPFLKEDENEWMKSVIQIVRNTSIYFQPQIKNYERRMGKLLA